MLSILGNIFIYSPHLFAATILSSQLKVQVSSQGIHSSTDFQDAEYFIDNLLKDWKSLILYPDNAHRLLFCLIARNF